MCREDDPSCFHLLCSVHCDLFWWTPKYPNICQEYLFSSFCWFVIIPPSPGHRVSKPQTRPTLTFLPHVLSCFFSHPNCVCFKISRTVSICDRGHKNIFQDKPWCFFNHMVFVPEPNRSVVTRETENSTWTNFKLRPVWVRLWFYRIVANISSGDCVGLIPQQCLIWLHL